jgi:hypothetical protein
MKTTREEVEESINDSRDTGTPRVEMTCTSLHLLEQNMKTTEEEVEK